MDTVITGIKLLITIFVVHYIASTIYKERNNFSFIWKIWRQFSIKMFVENIFILILLSIALFYLMQVPFLNWGWTNLFYAGGGNIVAVPIEGGTSENNIIVTLTICFLFMLILTLPFLASYEERRFRGGYYKWRAMIRQSIKFGLVHLFMGIPLAAGLVIIIPGFFLAYQYRKSFIDSAKELLDMQDASTERVISAIEQTEIDGKPEIKSAANEAALLRSTSYHTLLNTMLLGTLLILLILLKTITLLIPSINIVIK